MSAGMSTELLSIEPKGQARATLLLINAIRLRIQQDVQEAFTRLSQGVWVAASKQAIRLLLESLPHRPSHQDMRVLVLESISAPNLNLLHAHFRFVAARETGVKFLPPEELSGALEALQRQPRATYGSSELVSRARWRTEAGLQSICCDGFRADSSSW
jgi:hypothetical protein